MLTRILAGCLASIGSLAVTDTTIAADFTCWQPKKALTAEASEDYWTEERRDGAIPEDDGGAIDNSPDVEQLQVTAPVDVTTTPYKYGGKLFYTRDGVNYQASAQFAVEDNILLAAAHSMWRGDKQAENIVFYRAYANGGGTKYDIDRAAILTAWIAISADPPSLGRAASDYAALRTTKASEAGVFTLSKDGGFTDVTMMGYPDNFGGGEVMYKQDSTKLATVGSAYQAAPTEFGTGSSGGAWFVAGGTPIVSVVSGRILNGRTMTMIGPALTDTTEEMIAFVKDGCPS